MRTNKLLTPLALILILAFIVACGTASAPESADAPQPAQPQAPVQVPSQPQSQPQQKNQEQPKESAAPGAKAEPTMAPVMVAKPEGPLNVGLKEIGRFIAHPSEQQNPQIFVVGTAPVTEGLLHMTLDREVVGKLAESWEISPDGVDWTFNIRKGVQFHKGYGEVTAEDVLYSYRQWPLSKHPRAGQIGSIFEEREGTEIRDPYTLVVNAGEPISDAVGFRFFISPGGGATWVVSKKQSEELGVEAASVNIAATGPWEFIEEQQGQFWRMAAVEDHWRQTPHFAELVYWEIPEESSRIAGFQTGQLDTFAMSFDTIPLVKAVEGAEVMSIANAQQSNLRIYGNWHPIEGVEARPGYDPDLPWVSPSDDFASQEWDRARKVRQALMYAIDRQAIVETILGGLGNTENPLGNYLGFANLLEGRNWEYDPDRARELLAEAGYGDGFSMTLTPSIRGAPGEVEACEVVAQYLEDVGIDVNFQRVPYTTLRPQLVARTYQGATCHAGSPYLTPAYGYGSYMSDNPFNRGIEIDWLEKKMREAMGEVNTEKRRALEKEIGQFIFDNALTDLDLYTIDAIAPVGPRLSVEGWKENVNPNDLRQMNGYEFIRHKQK